MAEDIEVTFSPVPSLAGMFRATTSHLFIFVLGPVGSTKTTSCLYWLLGKALAQEPSPDKIRRTRFAIVRNTLVDLKRTVLKDALSLFGKLAEWRASENTLHIRVADIESEWIFIPLDDEEDKKKLLSLQLSGVYINEAREVEFEMMMQAFTRAGRFPSMMHGGVLCTHRFLLADSNMGVDGSKLYKFLEEDRPPELLYIHQPGAFDPRADWLQFLPENYYQPMLIVNTQAWIDTHVHAKWSHDLSGEPVFAGIFNHQYHVARQSITCVPEIPLVVGLDPGLNPAALVTQGSARGQTRVLAEIFAPNLLFSDFIDGYLLPTLRTQRFVLRKILFVTDPTAINRAATAQNSAKGMLEERGLEVYVAATNDVDPRIKAIERFLTEIRGMNSETGLPDPALLIDPYCQILIEALGGKYRYVREKRSGELNPKPEKKHPISDVTDCLGYVGVGMSTRAIQRRLTMADGWGQRAHTPPPPRRGWT